MRQIGSDSPWVVMNKFRHNKYSYIQDYQGNRGVYPDNNIV